MRKKMKKLLTGIKKATFVKEEMFKAVVSALIISYMLCPATASASGGYTTAITNLKSVLLTILAPVGVLLLIFGIVRFAVAFQKMDQNGEHSAIFTIVAGSILVGGSALLAALG